MGKRNREKRRSKQAARARRRAEPGRANRPGGGGGGGGGSSTGTAGASASGGSTRRPSIAAIIEAAIDAHLQQRDEFASLITLLAGDSADQVTCKAVEDYIEEHLIWACATMLGHGWGPVDLWQIARRKAGATAAGLVAGVLPRAVWRATDPSNRSPVADELDLIREGHQLDHRAAQWRDDLAAAVVVLSLVLTLPRLQPLAEPGTVAEADTVPPEHAALLAKIRALLAKAESTEFPEEAEAFTLKASQLMARHRIDQAVLEVDRPRSTSRSVVARRLWLEDPYIAAKGVLLHVVSEANGCRAIRHDLGFATVFGLAENLDLTEILFTSLLVQATRQMALVGKIRETRSASFRRSFLLAFAQRISERLKEANKAEADTAAAEIGESFLPVLARQRDDVDDAVSRVFPKLSRTRLTAVDPAGWAAGTAAADLADLAAGSVLDEAATG
jgi:hypothetical protein